MFQSSFRSFAVVLTMSGPTSQTAALDAAESTWLAAAAPLLALRLSSAHKG